MRNVGRWLTLFAVPVLIMLVIATMTGDAHAATLHASHSILAFSPHAFNVGLLSVPLLMGNTAVLTSKSREANQFRADAQKLRDEIADTSKPLTKSELEQKAEQINTLEHRANLIAGFTGTEEIRRQDDDDEHPSGLERIDSPEGDAQGDTPRDEQKRKMHLKRKSMSARIENFAGRVGDEFGNVRNFLDTMIGRQGNQISPKQRKLMDECGVLTRAIVGTTGDVSGGEFLLPLTQVQSIFSLANVQQGVLQRARTYNVPGRTLRIPYLIQDDSAASTTLNRPMAGNIANVSIVGEGSTKPALTPKFGQRLLTVFKYAAITQVSDEMLNDDFTGELPTDFINAVGQQALNKFNEDVTIDGGGTTEPDGAIHASAAWTISVTRNTGGSILPVDVFAMYSRHTHGPNSFWLASRRTVEKLYNMSLTSASLVTFLKDLNGVPQMSLLGYPIILSDLLPSLGSAGDFALINPDFYAIALRQALTVQSSTDFAFTQDLTTYRFVLRGGGIPINLGKYAYKYTGTQGVDEHSPFVYLT